MNEQDRLEKLAAEGLPNNYFHRVTPGARGYGQHWSQDLASLISAIEPGSDALIEGLIAAEAVITAGFEENFYNQVDEMGVPWEPRVDNEPHPLLIKTGRMFAAATNPASPEHFTDFTDTSLETGISDAVPYAIFHHYGTSRMPSRRVIFASEATINRALEAFADAAEESLFD
jgi:hypothetical protein